MEPLTIAALISGGISAAGSIANYFINRNRNQVLDNRDDTAIQRRIADLRAAGLNPLLAAGTGANTTTGMSMGIDTSQAGNFMQNLFDLKNQRETYKQNQLYTKMMEAQYADSRLNSILNNMQFNALIGSEASGRVGAKYDKFGNLLQTPSYLSLGDGKNIFENIANSPYFNTLKNQAQFNLNQTLFNLKTQGYQNSLELTKDTLEPLIQIGGLLNPIGNFYQAINGRKNFNTSSFNGTWQSENRNYNYNYKR